MKGPPRHKRRKTVTMRKYILIFIILIPVILSLCLFPAGCGWAAGSTADTGKLSIVTTNFPIYDFARQICKDAANVTLLLPPGTESHTYEPSPRDIIKIQDCDLFIYIGGNDDTWVDKILSNMDKPVTAIKMMDHVDPLSDETMEEMENGTPAGGNSGSSGSGGNFGGNFGGNSGDNNSNNSAGNNAANYDPHIWTAPKNAVKMVTAILDEICKLPKNGNDTGNDFYKSNAQAYIDKINKLDTDFAGFFQTVKNKTLIFGDRFPFRYFADSYGLTCYAAFSSCSDQSEPGTATVAFLIDKVKKEKVSTIFYIEFSNHIVADNIARSTGAKTALLSSCHNVSSSEMKNGATYVSLMEQNLTTLKGAMN